MFYLVSRALLAVILTDLVGNWQVKFCVCDCKECTGEEIALAEDMHGEGPWLSY